MNKRTMLLGLGAAALAGCATTTRSRGYRIAVAPISPSPKEVGGRAADAYLATPNIQQIRAAYFGVHCAEAAAGYGVAAFASTTGDKALMDRIKARHDRVISEKIANSEDHVDVSAYGVWPLELGMRLGDADLVARGRSFADNQWKKTTPEGLTFQARDWVEDIWMVGALQVQAFRATGDPKYLDQAALMTRIYLARHQEENGLFFHGPTARFHWARGNGWVASGLSEILSELPPTHKDYPAIYSGYQRMMAGLLKHQADDGMWRQLINYPEAWKETSSTAMFSYAMVVGVRRGLLTDPAYTQAYRKAWTTLATYVQPDGKLREIGAGTGLADNAQFYLDRPRRIGDNHGQAPLLWLVNALEA